jgi:hypothetical protein
MTMPTRPTYRTIVCVAVCSKAWCSGNIWNRAWCWPEVAYPTPRSLLLYLWGERALGVAGGVVPRRLLLVKERARWLLRP